MSIMETTYEPDRTAAGGGLPEALGGLERSTCHLCAAWTTWHE